MTGPVSPHKKKTRIELSGSLNHRVNLIFVRFVFFVETFKEFRRARYVACDSVRRKTLALTSSPTSTLRSSLTRKGRGFLRQEAHVRARPECQGT